MNMFHLRILTPDRPFYDGECRSLVVQTDSGKYGIMAHHSNMISAILPGELKYEDPDGKVIIAVVSNGIVKVEDNEVLILAETAELPEEIDENRARIAADEAKEALLQKRSLQEHRLARERMARKLSRLRAVHANYKYK